MRLVTSFRAASLLAALLALVSPSRVFAQSSTGDTVRVCVVPGTGTIYRLGASGACLATSHTIMVWSAIGPKGPSGPAGPMGQTGPAGPSGLPCSQCVTSGSIADGAVTDAKFGVISAPGKVANSATSASTAATPSAIVLRDGAGGVAANVITGTAFTSSGNVTAAGTLFGGSLQLNDGTFVVGSGVLAAKVSGGVTIYSSADFANGVRLAPGANFWSPIGGSPPLTEESEVAKGLRNDLDSAARRVRELEATNAALARRVEEQDRRLAAIEAALARTNPREQDRR